MKYPPPLLDREDLGLLVDRCRIGDVTERAQRLFVRAATDGMVDVPDWKPTPYTWDEGDGVWVHSPLPEHRK